MSFEPKTINNMFLSKFWAYWTDAHLRIVKLELGGQQLPVMKKNLSTNSLKPEKSSFFYKVLKTYVFTQVTGLVHFYHDFLR